MIETKFKRTEVGMIPEDWEVKILRDLCNIYGRIGFRGYTCYDLVAPGCGAITLSPTNITDSKMDYSVCTFISWQKYEESPEIKIYNNDILFVKTGSTFGKIAIIDDLTQKATINPQFVVLKQHKCESKFLFYKMNYSQFQNLVNSIVGGSTIPTISQEKLSHLSISLPKSRKEQSAISTALTNIDDLITALDKKIAKKKLIKQGAMQQLLTGKKRLLGFSGEWVEKKLGEISDFPSYGVGAEAIPFNGCVKYIRITDIDDESRKFRPKPLCSPSFYNDYYILKQNELVVARTGASVGKAYLYDSKDGQLVYAGFLIKLHINQCDAKLVFYHTLTKSYWDWINSESARTGQPGINLEQLKSFVIIIPTLPIEQTSIATLLSDMDKEISDLEAQRDKYKLIKQGMMQKLLTGQIRLI